MISLGIVGKTNVGKSTFFEASTMVPVERGNRPFVTIDPNVGVGYVRHRCAHVELGLEKCDPVDGFCIKGWRFIPVKLIDVAGLIPGASEGRGLGTQFLDNVRKADALLIIVDASGSTDAEGNPVPPGTHDPREDVRIFLREFEEWMFKNVSRDWRSFAMRVITSGEDVVEAIYKRLSGFNVKKEHVKIALEGMGKISSWDDNDLRKFIQKLVELRPKVIVANKADLPSAEEGIEKLKEFGIPVIPTSAEAELALRRASKVGLIEYIPGDSDFKIINESKLTPSQRKALDYIRRNVLEKWGNTGVIQSLNAAVFDELKMVVVFPVHDATRFTDSEGRILPEARLVPKGTKVIDFAAMIHSDLAKGFLYAIDARTRRRLGAEAEVEDGMVIKIVSARGR